MTLLHVRSSCSIDIILEIFPEGAVFQVSLYMLSEILRRLSLLYFSGVFSIFHPGYFQYIVGLYSVIFKFQYTTSSIDMVI